MACTLVNDACRNVQASADMLIADPPFDMEGTSFWNEIKHFDVEHYLLFLSMKQLLEFNRVCDLEFRFDLVWDLVSPKKSKAYHQPFYTHINLLYLTKSGVKSAFDRRAGNRSDVYSKGYFPSIFRASKKPSEHGHEKNLDSAIELLSYFSASSIIDAFSGAGTFSIAAYENSITQLFAVESDKDVFTTLISTMNFLSIPIHVSSNHD